MKLVKKNYEDRRLFIGTYQGFKITGNYKGIAERLIFTNIVDEFGNFIAPSTWFNGMKAFKELCLKEGDIVSFYARLVYFEDNSIVRYNNELYPRLLNPTKARKLIKPARSINQKEYCKIQIKPTKFK